MNSYLKLTSAETVVYNRAVKAIEPKEREVVMEWTNEWIEQGKAEGVLVGELKGQRRVLMRLLRGRLGTGVDTLTELIAKLSSEQLDELAEAFSGFASLSDARRWLAQRV